MYQGEKVRLREYRKEDVPMALAYMNDPEVKRLLVPGIPFLYTLEDELKWYDGISAMNDRYNFAMETLDTGHYIGGLGLNAVDWKNSIAVVGIFIGDKAYWGKGYGTDAMKVLIRFIFEQMNIRKIKLNVYAFNERAVKSYEKCGFVTEGVLKEEIYRDGKYHDEYIMAIFRDQYEAGK